MKSDVLTLISGSAQSRSTVTRRDPGNGRSRTQSRSSLRPQSIDELAAVARDALNDKFLEVSKVRPFFWSLVETYSDRFRAYPFNTFKALFSDLELRDFPAEELEKIVNELEAAYQLKHGKPLTRKSEIPSEYETLDEEIRELKDSLCYASLVAGDNDE
jgi:hypothetical protein